MSNIPNLKGKNFDELLELAGDKNRFQFKFLLILGLGCVGTATIMMMQPIFTQPPIFLCTDPHTGEKYDCKENNGGCVDQILSPNSPQSLAVEFGMYCDEGYKRSLAGSANFFGGMIGTLLLGQIADKIGRKPIILMGYAITAIGVYLLAFVADSANWFLACDFLFGFGLNPFFNVSCIIVNELSGATLRQYNNFILFLFWSFGEMIIVPIAYHFEGEWRNTMIYGVSIPFTIFMALQFAITESPRFLYSSHQFDKLGPLMKQIAYENKREQRFIRGIADLHREPSIHKNIEQKETASFKKVLRSKHLKTLVVLYALFMIYPYATYDGIFFAIASLGTNVYIDCLISGGSEFCSYILGMIIIPRVKRRTVYFTGLTLSFISGTLLLFAKLIDFKADFIIFFSLLVIKFCVSMMTTLHYLYGSEVFPTNVRSLCISIGVFTAKIFAVLSPFVSDIAEDIHINPIIIFGLLASLFFIVVKYLPETFGQPLKDEVSDTDGEDYKDVIKRSQKLGGTNMEPLMLKEEQ